MAFDLPTKLFTVDRSSPKQIHFYLEATIEGSVAYLEIVLHKHHYSLRYRQIPISGAMLVVTVLILASLE